MKSFQNQAVDIIEKRRLSQSEIAKRMGVSRAFVSQILYEKKNFTMSTMEKLASAIGCKLIIRLQEKGPEPIDFQI